MSATVRAASGLSQAATSQAIAEASASPLPGDLRVVFLTLGGTSAITQPSGWSALYNGPLGTVGYSLLITSKVYVPGVGNETWTWGGSSFFCDIELVSITGYDSVTPLTFTTNFSDTAGATVTATGLTPTVADALVLGYFSVAVGAGASTETLTLPSGMTQTTFHTTATASGIAGLTAWLADRGGGATGDKVSTANAAGQWRAALVSVPSAAPVRTRGVRQAVARASSY